MMHTLRLLVVGFLFALLAWPATVASAATDSPAQVAEQIRTTLVQAQLALADDPDTAQALLDQAKDAYTNLKTNTPTAAAAQTERVQNGFAQLDHALATSNQAAFAAGRAQVWTGLLATSFQIVQHAVLAKDATTAHAWLPVREFRTQTRFSRANADATLAITALRDSTVTPESAILAIRADLLDTYQARLVEALRNLADADSHNFAMRRAELAALAEGYFAILSPAYADQRGEAALRTAESAFAALRQAALTGAALTTPTQSVMTVLQDFRAAPLSPSERARRAGQLIRYLGLVPVEYGRGVNDGHVTKALEIQEAVTFFAGAQAAFADLQDLLRGLDAETTQQAAALLQTLDQQLNAASTGAAVADAETVKTLTDQTTQLLASVIPAEWSQAGGASDFDVINAMLDQMENAARAGEFALAESARLEAYAMMESGPEARLMVFAPQLKLRLEELFWNGQGEDKGLAYLIRQNASLREIHNTRAALDQALAEAQAMLSESSAPAAVLTNASVIVFREGLEAVVILASLLGSLKLGESRQYRKPLWWGTALVFVATILTWLLARSVLVSFARYGEKLEAVVSVVAIAVLLLITNWFFHKVYWNDWIASFHARKRQLLSGEAGLLLGLMTLGFTSVYREGFETVLFLQALVLESGTAVVLGGVALGLLGTLVVGLITFRLQTRLPYKKMLIVTGVLIGGVLLMMVGTTVHVFQVVGWLSIHIVQGLTIPFWLGTWLGLYPTWEGIGLQLAAALFVIGSYYWAEHRLHTRRPATSPARGVEVVKRPHAV